MGLKDKTARWWRRHFLYAGGARKLKVHKVDPDELVKGIQHEMEHTTSPEVAMKIALDHLAEHKHYYTALEKMEYILKLEKKGKR